MFDNCSPRASAVSVRLTSGDSTPSRFASHPSKSSSVSALLRFNGSIPKCTSHPSGMPSPNDGNKLRIEKPSQLYLSESFTNGSVPNHKSSPTGDPASVQAFNKFWKVAFVPVGIYGQLVNSEPSGKVALHHNPSNSVVWFDGAP